jgi:hypothetical protein
MGIHRLAAFSSSCHAKCLQRQLYCRAAGTDNIPGKVLKQVSLQNSNSSGTHGNSASPPAFLPSSRVPHFPTEHSNRIPQAQAWFTKNFRGWKPEGMDPVIKRAFQCAQASKGGVPVRISSDVSRGTLPCYNTRRGMLFQKPRRGGAISLQEQHAVVISIFGTGVIALHWYLTRDIASCVKMASVNVICASLLLPQVQGFLRRTRLAKTLSRVLHDQCHHKPPQNRFLRMLMVSAQNLLTCQNHIRDDLLDLRESIGYITRHGIVKDVLGDNVQLTASKLTREVRAVCVYVCVCVCVFRYIIWHGIVYVFRYCVCI